MNGMGNGFFRPKVQGLIIARNSQVSPLISVCDSIKVMATIPGRSSGEICREADAEGVTLSGKRTGAESGEKYY